MENANSASDLILLVDDNPRSLKPLSQILEQAEYRVAVALNGTTAIKQARTLLPDLILLDVMMPGMDGFETCRHFKANDLTRDIPVIFMTALTKTEDKVKGFETGGVDYISKPIAHREVLARVNTHLTNRKLRQRLEREKFRFQTLANAAFEGIVILEEGRIADVNKPFEDMFGFSRSDVLERDILEFVTPVCRQMVNEHLRELNSQPSEIEAIRRDGSHFPAEIQAKTRQQNGQALRIAAIRDLSRQKAMERENDALRAGLTDRYKFGSLIGKSQAMQSVYEAIARASASDATVLLTGETGTGKELAARTIHELSDRAAQKFVAVNCGAVPETLFEREFFGHRKGAFTGATMDKPGFFDQAAGGTLLLDEIGELSPLLQVKLLRVLQEKEYRPLGDSRSKQVDVRIIAATHKDLKKRLQEGLIRKDFFYRIRVISIALPPLRDRKEDIPLLVDHFLEQLSGSQDTPALPGRIVETLCSYHWPGNIRELHNELQRYLVERRFEFFGDVSSETPEHGVNPGIGFDPRGMSFNEAVAAFEQQLLADALARNDWHQGKTSQEIGIPTRTLYSKIKKYGLKAP